MAADSIIEAIIEIGVDILELAFDRDNVSTKNSKKSTKPGCIIWFFVFIIVSIILFLIL